MDEQNRLMTVINIPRTWSIILALIFVIGFGTSHAKTREGMDVVLVLDSSGSMKRNDPKRMRVEAAKMFVTLMDQKDRIAVVSFSGKAETKANLLSLDSPKNEAQLLKAIDKISASGAHTNIHDALSQGYRLLKRSKRKEKILVLMSDGKMDVGEREKDRQLLESTLNVLTPALAKKGIKVYSIGFTENSYMPLLKLAAKDTNGHFALLKSANGIHQVFENIFERSKDPDMLPMQEDSFIVDKSVKEITIVASKFRPNSIISLENPSGEDFNEETESSRLKWFSAKKFDLITIKDPTPGYWQIKFSEGGNKAYVLTDLQLEVTASKKEVQPGNPFQIQAWLEKKGKRVTKRRLLDTTAFRATITYPDGSQEDTKLSDDGSEIGSERKDGIYGNTFIFTNEGLHKLSIYTQGETFDRQKAVFVTVKSLGMQSPFEVQDEPKVAATPMPMTEPEPQPEPVMEEPAPQPEIAAEPPQLDINVDGSKDTLHEVERHKDVEAQSLDEKQQPAAETEEGIDVTSAIIAFILLNLGIGGGVGGWFFFKKYKKKKQEEQDKADGVVSEGDNTIDLSDDDDQADPLSEDHDASEEGGENDDTPAEESEDVLKE